MKLLRDTWIIFQRQMLLVVRTPIRLAYFGGRSYRQVAEELDVPEGTVKSRIQRGRYQLRDLLRPFVQPEA